MKDATQGSSGILVSPWIGRAPLLAAALLALLVNAINIDRHYRSACPSDPWEAAETVEAYRSLTGMPVYDPTPDAHSTHMYGALAPWTLAEVFRIVGPNNGSGRLITLAASLATVLLLAGCTSGNRSVWFLLVASALFFGLNHRSGNYFIVNRPDMPALLCAALGVVLMGWGHEFRRWPLVIAGTGCLIVGFFFKQTAAIAGVVPAVALVLKGRRPTLPQVIFAIFPAAVMFGVVQGLKLANPAMYRSMILMPKAFALNWPGAVKTAWELLLDYPLVLVLIGEGIARDRRPLREQPVLLWIVATFAITYPFSALTAAKAGGTNNSLLPALLTMSAFVALRLPRITTVLDNRETHPLRRLAFGTFLGLLLLMCLFPHLTRRNNLLRPKTAMGAAYAKAVEGARGLPGVVRSPEDPTIAVLAKGQVGRNLYSEYDCHLVNGEWPDQPPAPALAELESADYIVDVRGWWQDILDDGQLESLGFVPVADPAFDETYYRLWRRVTK
ncbi:MAG: hypothetical protein P4L84_04255 [Isosphaeraceae bacterium]|nr:hypothetical protein [Isosphaeraceae bacterium]